MRNQHPNFDGGKLMTQKKLSSVAFTIKNKELLFWQNYKNTILIG